MCYIDVKYNVYTMCIVLNIICNICYNIQYYAYIKT